MASRGLTIRNSSEVRCGLSEAVQSFSGPLARLNVAVKLSRASLLLRGISIAGLHGFVAAVHELVGALQGRFGAMQESS